MKHTLTREFLIGILYNLFKKWKAKKGSIDNSEIKNDNFLEFGNYKWKQNHTICLIV